MSTTLLLDVDHCTPIQRASCQRQYLQEIGADTILEDFDFPERDAFVSLYPQGYCNVDKQVLPTVMLS